MLAPIAAKAKKLCNAVERFTDGRRWGWSRPSDFSAPFLLSIGDEVSELDEAIWGEARWATAAAIRLGLLRHHEG